MSPEDLGLLPTLEQYVQLRAEQEDLVVRLHTEGRPRQLPTDIETTIFRIVEAALDNVRDHSGVNQAEVTLAFAERAVTVTIADGGRGYNQRLAAVASQGGAGLIGIRERAHRIGGDVEFISSPGRGTTVRLTVPLVGPLTSVGAARRRASGRL